MSERGQPAEASETTERRSATTIADEVARLDQALADLGACEAESVSLVHCPSRAQERSLLRELAQRARDRRFVTAQLSMLEHSPDTTGDLVAAVIDSLVPPGDKQPRGLLWLLDVFVERHGRSSAERFAEAAETFGADGDLKALCGGYLEAEEDEVAHAVRAYEAWLEGTEPGARSRNPEVRRPLTERTAQRALSELSRVLRALGHAGLVVFLSEGDAIADRTERQRERGYTVLRELVDNFDTGDGAICTRVMLTGTDALFVGERSIQSLEPLLMRLQIPSDALPPPPHRSWTSLVREPYEWVHRRITPPPDNKTAATRTLVRISQGLPPTEAVTSMSVGHDKIERTVDRLFEHADMAGSVFTVLSGAYGSGKTHLMMHLAERALDEGRPVFWLNLERMNLDLGNPQRHLVRLLEHSQLPLRRRPSAADRAGQWTRSRAKLRQLETALEEIAESDGEESAAAHKALRMADEVEDRGYALEAFLTAADLAPRSGASYRHDAYRRVLLWVELLRRLEGCAGPVVLIDEAENLYTSGTPWARRRAALRSLAFYCGGALPSAAVVMAMTPPTFRELKREARELLGEASEQSSTLDIEDVELFRRRLHRLQPQEVPVLSRNARIELAERVRKTHRAVRGAVDFPDWQSHARRMAREHDSPRTLVRALVDQLESTWWAG